MTAQPHLSPVTPISKNATPLEELIRHGRDLTAQIAALGEELDEVKRRVRAVVPAGDTVDVDGKPVKVIAVMRFNEQQALSVLPPSLIELCQTTKLDSAAAKKNLPPALYAECCKPSGEPSVHGLA